MFSFKSKGDWKRTEHFLKKASEFSPEKILEKYGERGVIALSQNTPLDSGKTASSWKYEIIQNGDNYELVWSNTNVNNHVNIAVILQFGHLTGTGGWVEGTDYINPALQPIFDEIADEAWKEVNKA